MSPNIQNVKEMLFLVTYRIQKTDLGWQKYFDNGLKYNTLVQYNNYVCQEKVSQLDHFVLAKTFRQQFLEIKYL